MLIVLLISCKGVFIFVFLIWNYCYWKFEMLT